MRFKKGFTLAEILIVLMVIGALATMTIPSLMKGVQEAQWKTAYKKAYNNIANIMATEKIASGLPGKSGQLGYMYDKLNQYLSVKSWVDVAKDTAGTAVSKADISATSIAANTSWLVADDGLSYRLVDGGGSSGCDTKADINTKTTIAEASTASCSLVLVDINGLTALPNLLDAKAYTSAADKTTNLTGDRFYIYIGSDGATAGNPTLLQTGRIVGDIK